MKDIVKVIAFIFLIILHALGEQQQSENETENNDLDTWEAPDETKINFPYTHAGYDDEGRPIWITEFGKYNLRKLVEEEGEEGTRILDKYTDQWAHRVQKSMADRNSTDNPVTGWIFIFDMESYSLSQLTSYRTLRYTLKQASVIEKVCRNMEHGFLINLNYVAETFLSFTKPFLGSTLERVTIGGTNRSKWMPAILKKLPKSQLPEQYGGFRNFTPISVTG